MAKPILRYSPGGGASRSVSATPVLQSTIGPGVTDGGTPILNYSPSGGTTVPTWPPLPSDLTYPECGTIQLVSGQDYIDVTFANEKPDVGWIFEDLQIVNTTDPTPLNIWPGVVTEKSITGFRLQLNGLPNTDNYFLHWAVGGCATSDWVVSSGATATNFLQLTDTPDEYVGQAGMGVKVNAEEDGLEFGVVAGGGSGDVINVLDYGAVADMVTLFDITMPNGNVVTSAAHTFVEADIGKWAVIRGATAGGESPLMGKITAVDGHDATLDHATTTALTNLYATDSFPRMDFGTDNTLAFVLACMAVPGPGNRYGFGTGPPFATTGEMNPIEPGDGGTVYIPRGNYLLATVWPGIADGTTTFWWIETNNLTLKGDGMGQTVIFRCSRTSGSMPIFGGFAGTHGMFQNWLICDMTFYDLNYFPGVGNSLNVHQVDNCHIERIEICNSRGNGGINYQGYPSGGATPVNTRLWIKDCWIHGITEDGYTPGLFHSIEGDAMNVGEVGDVHIEGNTILCPGRHGYEGGGNCADQYFIGNTIEMRNPVGGSSGGISGINPTGGSTTVIMGNTIKGVSNAGFGIDFTVDVGPYVANDIRIIGNYVHGNMQAGFRFQNTSGDTASEHLDRIIVANNWVVGDTNVSTSGITIGGGSGEHPSMLITDNWFGNLGNALATVAGLGAATGKWIILKNNVIAASSGTPVNDDCLSGNIIIEDNVMPAASVNRYGGKGMSCNIDGNNVLAGANYSNTATGIGYRLTDSVEVVRGATTAGGLIIWAQVTAVGPPDTVTTYVYNPTGGTLNTGASTTYIVHRRLP